MGRVKKELFQQLRQPLRGDKECEGRERLRASQLVVGRQQLNSKESFGKLVIEGQKYSENVVEEVIIVT